MKESKKVENSNKGVASANPGDIIIRSDGSKVELTQEDIDWAKQKLQQEAATESSTPSVKQPKTSSNSTTRTSPPSSQAPTTSNQTSETTDDGSVSTPETNEVKNETKDQNAVVEDEKKHPARKVYGQVDSKDVKGKFVYLSVSKSKGTMDVFVSRDESGKKVEKTATFNVVTNVQKNSKDSSKASDTSRRQKNKTNPTQVHNGIYKISNTGVPKPKYEGDIRFGEEGQGLVVNIRQELPDSASQYVEDGGYLTHITPYDYTDGCVGFKYIDGNPFSRQTALNQQMYLVSLFNDCVNSDSQMYIEYKD